MVYDNKNSADNFIKKSDNVIFPSTGKSDLSVDSSYNNWLSDLSNDKFFAPFSGSFSDKFNPSIASFNQHIGDLTGGTKLEEVSPTPSKLSGSVLWGDTDSPIFSNGFITNDNSAKFVDLVHPDDEGILNANLPVKLESSLLGDYYASHAIEPKPFSKEDVIEIVKEAMREIAEEGAVKGAEKAIQKMMPRIIKEIVDPKQKEYNLSYKNKMICFCGKEIPVPEDTNIEQVCRVIFRDKESMLKDWSNDEMIECWDTQIEICKKNLRKVYTAGLALNEKIAMETTIKELFLVTTKSIRINPFYLNK